MFDYRAVLVIQLSVDFLRVVQFYFPSNFNLLSVFFFFCFFCFFSVWRTMLHLVNINAYADIFRVVFTFSEFEPRQRLGQSQMTSDNLFGYILSISVCMQSFITIVHSVGPFSFFHNLELGTASTDVKCHFAISWARFGNPSV